MSPQPGPPTLYVPVVPLHDKYLPAQRLLEQYPGLRYRRFLEAPVRVDARDSHSLPLGPHGRPLCRWCGLETSGQPFCAGTQCRHEYTVRRDGQYVRKQLYQRDRGICDQCTVDTFQMLKQANSCTGLAQRRRLVRQWKSEQNAEWGNKMRKPLNSMQEQFLPGMFWEAAHIVDVQEGGGVCGLEGFRTLCAPCHFEETSARHRALLKNIQHRCPTCGDLPLARPLRVRAKSSPSLCVEYARYEFGRASISADRRLPAACSRSDLTPRESPKESPAKAAARISDAVARVSASLACCRISAEKPRVPEPVSPESASPDSAAKGDSDAFATDSTTASSTTSTTSTSSGTAANGR
ncbi:hypothetical protein DL89DRAFT_53940 [Linderina pennispora]|uniref:Uncharacterized protein n=1 Tax=Linderina pennispora TaxID=61395 RepID=A0A1Y1W0V5_9FUNG|nr:uncharacterized protein DL89DRAFT_53940 [Linderina pennispora]ORX67169.1 hypothetical protein DL89DRAFT_53940 [Linderina pennispora]